MRPSHARNLRASAFFRLISAACCPGGFGCYRLFYWASSIKRRRRNLLCLFEYSFQGSIQSLSANGISSPDLRVGGPNAGKAWATGASEKLYKKTKADLEAIFENMPELERKYAKTRVLSCSGIGAQWLAQTQICHLTQLPDDDMCSAIQYFLCRYLSAYQFGWRRMWESM